MRVLENITIKNFKSIRDQTLELGALNVFIGANGAGKSNLVEAFRLVREIAGRRLAAYSLKRGLDRLLYLGRKGSAFIEISLEFGENNIGNGYEIRLVPSDDGALIVDYETVAFHRREQYPDPYVISINSGSKEAVLATSAEPVARFVNKDVDSYRLYHFHDTSDSAAIKSAGALEDNRFLRPDASNLAAFLYLLQQQHSGYFRNIEDTVRQIAPFFERFNLAPSRLSPDKIQLEWKQQGTDAYFDAASLSDGTLRFMCLTTLLLQPELPRLVLLDEPELGLHPAAITLLASLLSSASTRTQVLVATQSVTLVNQFGPDSVWTVEREDNQSVFRHLGNQDLGKWLEEYQDYEGYGLGELWEKNIIGARP
jgi:predicted ATPase